MVKTTNRTFCVETEVLEKLQKMADEDSRSLSNMLTLLLKKAMKSEEKK